MKDVGVRVTAVPLSPLTAHPPYFPLLSPLTAHPPYFPLPLPSLHTHLTLQPSRPFPFPSLPFPFPFSNSSSFMSLHHTYLPSLYFCIFTYFSSTVPSSLLYCSFVSFSSSILLYTFLSSSFLFSSPFSFLPFLYSLLASFLFYCKHYCVLLSSEKNLPLIPSYLFQ